PPDRRRRAGVRPGEEHLVVARAAARRAPGRRRAARRRPALRDHRQPHRHQPANDDVVAEDRVPVAQSRATHPRVSFTCRELPVRSDQHISTEALMLKSLAVGAVGLLVLAVFPLLAADDKPAGASGAEEQAAAAKQRAGGASADPSAATDWAMNATIIEACSCPMFCQCYFSTEPAGHASGHEGHAGHGEGAEHYCK